MQPIEFYTDYRIYLSDYYHYKKKTSGFFSYRQFCIKAGLKSPSIYREVVSGKRNLTPSTIASFIKGVGFSERDGKFFENLVFFNQAKSEESKKKYLAILRGLRYRKPQKLIPVHLYEYYEKWYHPVIRELAAAFDWNDDFAILGRAVNPAIKTSEARESVELLLRIGFLKKLENGSYVQTSPDITTGAEVNSLSIRQLNRTYARLGLEAIDRFPPSERDISSIIMGIPKCKLTELKQVIVDFRKRIIELADNESEEIDSFYSLVIELFPVGQTTISKESDDEKTA
ncbi:MAG TPA: TIGR02147 family protein [Chitinispirillaceae bacterium]|nr:TIGR02147 family protein [Chitinispirillaceae bacterium]